MSANIKVDGKKLTVTVPDLSNEKGVSASGKTILIATASEKIAGPGGHQLTVQLNVYRKNPDYRKP